MTARRVPGAADWTRLVNRCAAAYVVAVVAFALGAVAVRLS